MEMTQSRDGCVKKSERIFTVQAFTRSRTGLIPEEPIMSMSREDALQQATHLGREKAGVVVWMNELGEIDLIAGVANPVVIYVTGEIPRSIRPAS
jgi:hypothetical protein